MKVLRLRQVIELTGVSRMTVYRMEARGEFPKRRRLGRNSVGWMEEEVLQWIQSRPPIESPACLMRSFTGLPRL